MDEDLRQRVRVLQTLVAAQGLALPSEMVDVVATVHAGHRRQALLLRAGVALTDEPATVFTPLYVTKDDDATTSRD